jgi:hypothetical protein
MADEFTIHESVDDIGADTFEICEGKEYIASCVDRETAERIVAALRNTRATPEPSEAEVEAVAEAICRAEGFEPFGEKEKLGVFRYALYRGAARAAIAALRAANKGEGR